LSSGSLLSLQKTQNWNQRTRSATADPETDHRPPLVQTPDLVIIGTNITWEQRDETKGLWNPETLSLQFTIASIRQDLEKMELKSCNICKSLPIDICTYVWEPQLLASTLLLHKATNKLQVLYKKTIYRCSVLGTS
jgi:hypothetical protein